MADVSRSIDLICPAGTLPALRAAVDNGANAVYMGFRDETNARNFPGLNFDANTARKGIHYAHDHNCQVLLALNTFPQPSSWKKWTNALAIAVELGIDAVILADMGLLRYASRTYPDLRLHLSVQGSVTNRHAIKFYHEHFGIKRAVLPRVLSLPQVRNIVESSPVEVEVFGFGSLCVMVEGRCILSSYVTGESPNTCGVCSPAKSVRWQETPLGRESRLNGVLIDRYAAHEHAGYPTLCKGRFQVNNKVYYAIEEPTSLNALEILPQLYDIGVSAIKVEGRQRSPAYVALVTKILRQALDTCLADPKKFTLDNEWLTALDNVSEGTSHTLGALHRPWQ